MKYHHLILGGAVAAALFSGCAGVTQPSVPITPEITSLKDYIIKKRAKKNSHRYAIIAEDTNQTLIEYRTESELENSTSGITLEDFIKVIEDANEYCQGIGGQGVYGDYMINFLNRHQIYILNVHLLSYRNKINAQGKGHYQGFYKCNSEKDGFAIDGMINGGEIERRRLIGGGGYLLDYSRYYHVIHDKPQKQGAKLWFFNEERMNHLKGVVIPEWFQVDKNNKTIFKPNGIRYIQELCEVKGGNLYIANSRTSHKTMSINDYYFALFKEVELNQVSTEEDYLWCENPSNPSQEFTLHHEDTQEEKYPALWYRSGVDKPFLKSKGVSFERTYTIKKEEYRSKVKNNDKEYTHEEYKLASKTLASKMDTFQMVGGIEYETSYNGVEPDNCEYAGVKKTLLGTQEIYNFKSCRGQISYIGKTGVEGLTREVKERFNASRQRFETICKRQGQARIELNEFTFKCFSSPHSPDSYKWVVLKEGKMIP